MRHLHVAPFAVTSDGTVLLNIREYDGVTTVQNAVAHAGREGASVFIGVPLAKAEVRRALKQLEHGHREAASFIVGARRKRRGAPR